MENGTHISRNRIDLKCTKVQFEPRPRPDTRILTSDANFKHAPPNIPNTNVKCTVKANLTEKGIDIRKSNVSNSMYKTCSGHISKPVSRLITQM